MNDIPKDNTWRSMPVNPGSVTHHAHRFATRLEKTGLQVLSQETGDFRLSWPEVVQAFADCAEDAVDEHVRRQREKAAHIDAHAINAEAPEEAQGQPHRNSARSIIVHFNDGSERIIHTHHPIIQNGGWKMRNINGVPFFILGHGIPRQMIPLCNVKSIDLSEELL